MSFLWNRVCEYNPVFTGLIRTGRMWNSVSVAEKIPTVKHDRAAQCFTVSLNTAGTHDYATLRYNLTGDGEVNLMSTNVPESFRAQGIAAHLAKAAMDFVVEEKLKAHISCWYIKKYVEENPDLGVMQRHTRAPLNSVILSHQTDPSRYHRDGVYIQSAVKDLLAMIGCRICINSTLKPRPV
ncbi:hypothetical protein AALO_G00074790 [Alosa alosa]|uniref:Protein NATD1 n=1 Tax=Alosa alosa TaxID=278164 RepID=A0AAV6GVL1_9TELE|nr:hypothetical protein AALO_G00074790 [Alosa alosa]